MPHFREGVADVSFCGLSGNFLLNQSIAGFDPKPTWKGVEIRRPSRPCRLVAILLWLVIHSPGERQHHMQFGQLKRRDFIKAIATAAAAWPSRALGQRTPRPLLGIVSFGQREAALQSSWYPAFHEGLREAGWVPDQNLSVEYRFANSEQAQLEVSARDLVALGPAGGFVPTRPALPAVRKATPSIPIVFVSLGDPVAEGWVTSLAKPGGNLTGVAGLSPKLAGKRLELLRELVPSLLKVTVLWNPANSAEEVAVRMTEAAGRDLA